MKIILENSITSAESELKFIVAAEKNADFRNHQNWHVEVFNPVSEHITIFRQRIAAALTDPQIVCAGNLAKQRSGQYAIMFGAQSLQQAGVPNAGMGTTMHYLSRWAYELLLPAIEKALQEKV